VEFSSAYLVSLVEQLQQAGTLYGVPIFLASMYLFTAGAKQLPTTMVVCGFLIGYVFGASVSTYISLQIQLSESLIRFVIGFVGASVALAISQIFIRLLAGGLVYLLVTSIISAASKYGYDLENNNFWSGILTFIAFVSSFSFKQLLPAVMAGVVGSLGMIFGLYISLGINATRLHPSNGLDIWLCVPLTLLSCWIQYKFFIEKEKELEDDLSAEKELVPI